MTVVRLLQLHRWEVAVALEQPVVEPVDPIEGRCFDVFDGARHGAAAVDELGLEQPQDHEEPGLAVTPAEIGLRLKRYPRPVNHFDVVDVESHPVKSGWTQDL